MTDPKSVANYLVKLPRITIHTSELVFKSLQDAFEDGWMHPVEMDYQLNLLSKQIDGFRKSEEFKEAVLKYAPEFKENGYGDMSLEVIEKKSWNYPENDSELKELATNKKQIEKDIKARQVVLQNVKGTIVDKATGEEVKGAWANVGQYHKWVKRSK
jgi:hypothetical protein